MTGMSVPSSFRSILFRSLLVLPLLAGAACSDSGGGGGDIPLPDGGDPTPTATPMPDPCDGVDCPPGQECNPATGTCEMVDPCRDVNCPSGETCDPGTGMCIGGPAAEGEVGAGCERNADCFESGQGGRCLSEERTDGVFAGGYCTSDCRTAVPCPAGASCLEVQGGQICFDECASDLDCRESYVCQGISPDNPTSICVPLPGSDCEEPDAPASCTDDEGCAEGTCVFDEEGVGTCALCAPIGGACETDDDCLTNGTCLPDIGEDGYCWLQNCGEEAPCPGDNICLQISEAGDTACLDTCAPTDFDTCRAGQRCLRLGAAFVGIDTECLTNEDCMVVSETAECVRDQFSEDPGFCVQQCQDDGDCNEDAGHTCVETNQAGLFLCGDPWGLGVCWFRDCATDEDCVCMPGDPNCTPGQVCDSVRGACHDPCDDETALTECGPGRSCDDTGHCFSPCENADDDCGPNGKCDVDAGQCVFSCTSDDNCGEDNVCDVESGTCILPCDDDDAPECADSEYCDEDSKLCTIRCTEEGETCEDDQYCDETSGACTDKCVIDGETGDDDCDDDLVCNAETGVCEVAGSEPEDTDATCDDDLDNDGDGDTDCDDSDCADTAPCAPAVEDNCDDDVDNDEDGDTDCDDSDCTDDAACAAATEDNCDDDLDNDEDGDTDCDDSDCTDDAACAAATEDVCDDNMDNDEDGDTDCDDSDCTDNAACAEPDPETACDDDMDNDEDGDTDCDDSDCAEDAACVTVPSVTANAQTLDDLSTVVTVAEAVSDGPGWIVIHEDDGAGNFAGVIGQAALSDGTNTDVTVMLGRPAATGETLHAMLHTDTGTIGTYEFGDGSDNDGPVTDGDGNVIAPPFVVTVVDGTPAIRFTIGSNGVSGYTWTNTEPSLFADSIADGVDDNTVTLRPGWRYAIVNTVVGPHPFEFIDFGADMNDQTMDTVLLSQATDVVGSLEDSPVIAWSDADGTLMFTYDQALESMLEGYRCGIHRATMRGSFQSTR